MAQQEDPPIPSISCLRDDVICTTCLSLPRVGIFQCENGHLICAECRIRCRTLCPTCKKPLGKIRSLIAEKIISLMPLPCKHSDRGCLEELMKDKLVLHEDVCPFRPVCCVDIACNAKVSFNKMFNHMAKEHESGDFVHANGNEYISHIIVNEEDFERELFWISDHLTLEDRHFFREFQRCRDGIWFVWIYLLGTKKEADMFKATCKITLPETDEEVSYIGKVNALTHATRESPSTLNSLAFPDSVARRFWKNNRIHYCVKIEKVKEKKERKKKDKEGKKKRAEGPEEVLETNLDENSDGENCKKGGNKGKKEMIEKEENSEDVKETSC